jgi:hypothetical protein
VKINQWQRRLIEPETASSLPGKDKLLSHFTGRLAPFRYY